MGSNPLLGTLGNVSLTSSLGWPRPCEGIWADDESQNRAIVGVS